LTEALVELGGEVEREVGEVDHVRETLTVTESVTDVTVEMDVCKLVQRRDAARGSESGGEGARSGGSIRRGGGGGGKGGEVAEAKAAVVVEVWEAETEPEEAEGRGRGGRGCVGVGWAALQGIGVGGCEEYDKLEKTLVLEVEIKKVTTHPGRAYKQQRCSGRGTCCCCCSDGSRGGVPEGKT
jgi:hypothetical protein